MIGKVFLKWYDGGGLNGFTQKKEFEVKMFFSKYFHPYPHVKHFGAFFLSLFFSASFLSFLSMLYLLDYSIRDPLAPSISPGFYGSTDRGGAV
jgi:hypothetical protein